MQNTVKKTVGGGLSLGFINGLFGGGGGMIAVPVLSALGYPEKQAHATAIFIIAPVCAISALIYIIAGFINFNVLIPSTLGNVVGGLMGAKFLGKLPTVWVKIIFIAVMLAAGIRILVG